MLKHAPYLICIILLLASCTQDSDSTVTADTVIEIQNKLKTIPSDSIYHYLHRSHEILETHLEFPDSLRAENSYHFGLYYQKKGILDSASVYFHQATDFVKEHAVRNRDIHYFIKAWELYKVQGKYGDCISIAKKLKSLLNEEKDLKWMEWVYYFYETTYLEIPEYQKALDYNKLRVKVQKKTKDTSMIISTLLTQVRLKYNYLQKPKEAFELLDSLVGLENELYYNYNRHVNSTYGIYQFYEGNFQSSRDYYEKGISFTKQEPNIEVRNDLLSYGYANLAEVSIELEDYTAAQAYLDSLWTLGIKHIDDKTQNSFLIYGLRLASKTGSDVGSLESRMDSINKYRVSQYVKKYNNELVALTKANENEKELLANNQLKEIQNLKLETRLFTLATGTILVIIIGFLFLRQRRLNFEKKGLQMQQRLLRSQMNPHFTFNVLSSIQNLVESNQQKAANYLLKFSRQLRLTLENSMRNYVLMEKEINALKEYLELQLLRFPGAFNYKIELEDMEEDDPIFIPPMLLQPFIENSIEHGFSNIDYHGEITVILHYQTKFIGVTINDNGSGLKNNKNTHKQSASISLISDFLKKSTKTPINITNNTELSSLAKGVSVTFRIPFKTTGND